METAGITNTTSSTDIITMTDARLIRLFSWLSPLFPTGSFAYSQGLEQAVAGGKITGESGLATWLDDLIRHGSPWNDAVFLSLACRHHADEGKTGELAELCLAMASCEERLQELRDQGRSFTQAAEPWFSQAASLPEDFPLPVICGIACGRSGINAQEAISAWLNTFVSNQLQAAIRLSVLGQSGAARILAELEPSIAELASIAAIASEEYLGSCAFAAEIAAMKHETLQPRLFLS